MKRMKKTKYLLSCLLSCSLLLTALCACGPVGEGEGSSTSDTIVETGDAGDPTDPLILAADGQTAYSVIVPDYAAAWELSAADRLTDILSDYGVTAEPVMDTATEVAAKEIVVGYTNRNSALDDDFFAVGDLGYHVAAVGDKLFIGANTETGMNAALERLKGDLMSDGDRLMIARGYVCKAVGTSEGSTVYALTGAYAGSITYADQIANHINAYYTNGDRGLEREGFTVKNLNMSLSCELFTGGNGQVSRWCNADGIPYLRNTMSAYVVAGGETYYSKDSTASGRANLYRYGSYYYEAHILDQNFGDVLRQDESEEPYDFIASKRSFPGNNVTVKKNNSALTVVINAASDPHFYFGSSSHAVSAAQYDAIQLTVRTESCTSGQFLLAAGSHGSIDGSQCVDFTLIPDGETHTYIIPLDGVTDYKGNITALRLDLEGSAGEKIYVEEVKAIKTERSGIPPVLLDRTLHTYADKLHQELHFVATDAIDAENMTAYGMETEIDASRVRAMLIIDANGEHTSVDGVDWATVTAVAFDIDRAGVLGFILPDTDGVGQITVYERDGDYVIDQRQSARGSYAAYDEFYIGHRLYTDDSHHFDGFRAAHREEYEALTVTVTSTDFGGKYVGYDALRGAYRLELQGMDFGEAYDNQRDRHYRIDVQVEGNGTDRNVYLYTHTASGGLECAVLLDERDQVLPYLLQVSKNFQGENEEPIFDRGDESYGEVYFPIAVGGDETLTFSVLNLYQNWGIYALKQISSIQFFAPYYHLSTGVTETNCIAPYYVYGKDLWTLPDFRSMSAPLWSSQPQHTSGGRLYFLEYTDAEGHRYASEATGDEILSHGPVYSDIRMDYLSDDGRIAVEYRHLEMPQTDENRTYYQIHMTVLEDISFDNFKEDFTFFSMDGRSVFYSTLGYLDENDQSVVTTTNNTQTTAWHTLGKNAPFVSYSYVRNNRDYVNLAAIIKDWNVTVGGTAYDGGIVLADVKTAEGLNYARLTLDLGEVTLRAGDTLDFDMILLPWGSQLTASNDISSVLNVRNDTCLDPIKTEAKTGAVIDDPYMPLIRAENGTAEFTLSGADHLIAVRIYGFEDYGKPVIEEYKDGRWIPYETASANGYDGYSVYYDGDGTYSFAFIVDMSGDSPRTFRVVDQRSSGS